MSNMKIGDKLYRDVENMTMDQCQAVTQAIANERVRLSKIKGTTANVGYLLESVKILERHTKRIESIAKLRIKEHVATVVSAKAPDDGQ